MTKIKQKETKLFMIKEGFYMVLPLTLTYIPVAIAFGVIGEQIGFTLFELFAMSVLVYAGAAQFMAVQMVAVGAGVLEIIIAVFILNFRHFIMSFSFLNVFKKFPPKWRSIFTLGLTDETFALASLNKAHIKRDNSIYYYGTIFLLAYFSWVFGTIIGGILGDVIPSKLSESMEIALYAMFIGLLIPSIRNYWKIGLIALFAMFINWLSTFFVSSGWAIVIGTIIGGFLGVFIFEDEKK